MLKVGDKAINFKINDDKGNKISLESFRGKRVVLYFYPKDNTSGCTIEAEGFRDVYDEILDTGTIVAGVSPDKRKSHENFKEKYGLPFYLLSDENHSVAEAYGAWGEKACMVKSIWE